MKITTFNPMLLTPQSGDVIRIFEELGFKKTNSPSMDSDIGEVTLNHLRHSDGFDIDIASVQILPQDMTLIRMNVDNFEEAYEFLTAHGFKNAQGDRITDTGSSKATLMISPSGYGISLSQHIKK
jgi:hypothetical protein